MKKIKTPQGVELDEVIEQTEERLKELKIQKRRDAGIKRAKYDSHIPPIVRRYISRANKLGIPFELSVDDFQNIISSPCVYCGSSRQIGIDRLDSSDGYTHENSRPCCTMCNLMKNKHSQEEFLSHIQKIYGHCVKR